MEDPFPLLPPPFIVVCFIFALIIASGFFSLFENALRGSRKSRLQKEARDDSRGDRSREGGKYRRVLEAQENPFTLIAAVRGWICVLRILAAVLAGLYGPSFFAGVVRGEGAVSGSGAALGGGALVLLIAGLTTALSFAAVLFGELLPRFIAHSAPEQISATLLPLFSFLALPLGPPVSFARRFFSFLRAVFPASRPGITEDDLRIALLEGEKSGIVESKERTMVEGVFYLGDRQVGAFMTHRSEIQWLDVNAPGEDIRAKVLAYRAQRCFPVADGTLDAIIGAAYFDDIILDGASPSPQGLRAIMRKAQFVPETMTALKVFESFKRGEANFLFVMDEYGGFAGIISVRDLVEEIVGELSASKPEEDSIILQENGEWLADGSINIDDAAKALSLPDLGAEQDGYHTLAGFILSLAGELPRTGDSVSFQGFRFTVAEMDGNRIDKLRISREAEERY